MTEMQIQRYIDHTQKLKAWKKELKSSSRKSKIYFAKGKGLESFYKIWL